MLMLILITHFISAISANSSLSKINIHPEQEEKSKAEKMYEFIEQGNLQEIKILFEKLRSQNKKIPINGTKISAGIPLIEAIKRNHTDIVQFLLQEKASLNISDFHGNTPISTTIQQNNLSLLHLIVNHNNEKKVLEMAFYEACKQKKYVLAKECLQIDDLINVNLSDPYEQSPIKFVLKDLMIENTQDKIEFLEFLLQKKASPSIEYQLTTNSPLKVALQNKQLNVIELFFKHDSQNGNSLSSIALAQTISRNQSDELTQFIIEYQKRVEGITHQQILPSLTRFVTNNEIEKVQIILENYKLSTVDFIKLLENTPKNPDMKTLLYCYLPLDQEKDPQIQKLLEPQLQEKTTPENKLFNILLTYSPLNTTFLRKSHSKLVQKLFPNLSLSQQLIQTLITHTKKSSLEQVSSIINLFLSAFQESDRKILLKKIVQKSPQLHEQIKKIALQEHTNINPNTKLFLLSHLIEAQIIDYESLQIKEKESFKNFLFSNDLPLYLKIETQSQPASVYLSQEKINIAIAHAQQYFAHFQSEFLENFQTYLPHQSQPATLDMNRIKNNCLFIETILPMMIDNQNFLERVLSSLPYWSSFEQATIIKLLFEYVPQYIPFSHYPLLLKINQKDMTKKEEVQKVFSKNLNKFENYFKENINDFIGTHTSFQDTIFWIKFFLKHQKNEIFKLIFKNLSQLQKNKKVKVFEYLLNEMPQSLSIKEFNILLNQNTELFDPQEKEKKSNHIKKIMMTNIHQIENDLKNNTKQKIEDLSFQTLVHLIDICNQSQNFEILQLINSHIRSIPSKNRLQILSLIFATACKIKGKLFEQVELSFNQLNPFQQKTCLLSLLDIDPSAFTPLLYLKLIDSELNPIQIEKIKTKIKNNLTPLADNFINDFSNLFLNQDSKQLQTSYLFFEAFIPACLQNNRTDIIQFLFPQLPHLHISIQESIISNLFEIKPQFIRPRDYILLTDIHQKNTNRLKEVLHRMEKDFSLIQKDFIDHSTTYLQSQQSDTFLKHFSQMCLNKKAFKELQIMSQNFSQMKPQTKEACAKTLIQFDPQSIPFKDLISSYLSHENNWYSPEIEQIIIQKTKGLPFSSREERILYLSLVHKKGTRINETPLTFQQAQNTIAYWRLTHPNESFPDEKNFFSHTNLNHLEEIKNYTKALVNEPSDSEFKNETFKNELKSLNLLTQDEQKKLNEQQEVKEFKWAKDYQNFIYPWSILLALNSLDFEQNTKYKIPNYALGVKKEEQQKVQQKIPCWELLSWSHIHTPHLSPTLEKTLESIWENPDSPLFATLEEASMLILHQLQKSPKTKKSFILMLEPIQKKFEKKEENQEEFNISPLLEFFLEKNIDMTLLDLPLELLIWVEKNTPHFYESFKKLLEESQHEIFFKRLCLFAPQICLELNDQETKEEWIALLSDSSKSTIEIQKKWTLFLNKIIKKQSENLIKNQFDSKIFKKRKTPSGNQLMYYFQHLIKDTETNTTPADLEKNISQEEYIVFKSWQTNVLRKKISHSEELKTKKNEWYKTVKDTLEKLEKVITLTTPERRKYLLSILPSIMQYLTNCYAQTQFVHLTLEYLLSNRPSIFENLNEAFYDSAMNHRTELVKKIAQYNHEDEYVHVHIVNFGLRIGLEKKWGLNPDIIRSLTEEKDKRTTENEKVFKKTVIEKFNQKYQVTPVILEDFIQKSFSESFLTKKNREQDLVASHASALSKNQVDVWDEHYEIFKIESIIDILEKHKLVRKKTLKLQENKTTMIHLFSQKKNPKFTPQSQSFTITPSVLQIIKNKKLQQYA